MHDQELNYEKPEEELGSAYQSFQISLKMKILVSAISMVMLTGSLCLFVLYIKETSIHASPRDLGLVSIFIFSLSAIFLVWLPWEKMGIRISKIGGVEFQKIVATQASENAEETAYLEERLEVLEERVHNLDQGKTFLENFQEKELRNLLIKFLEKYSQWAFSPTRIKSWGSKQQGFSKLANYELPFIRRALKKMVADEQLETRISKKGNTLYRIPMP